MLASKNRMLGESIAFAPRNESLAYWLKLHKRLEIHERLKLHERLEIHELGRWEVEIRVTRDIIMK